MKTKRTRKLSSSLFLIFIFLIILVLFHRPNVFAGTITVTTEGDTLSEDGLCSLREAIEAASRNSSYYGCQKEDSENIDTILLPVGTYELLRGPLSIVSGNSLTLKGDGFDQTEIVKERQSATTSYDSTIISTGNIPSFTLDSVKLKWIGGAGTLYYRDVLKANSDSNTVNVYNSWIEGAHYGITPYRGVNPNIILNINNTVIQQTGHGIRYDAYYSIHKNSTNDRDRVLSDVEVNINGSTISHNTVGIYFGTRGNWSSQTITIVDSSISENSSGITTCGFDSNITIINSTISGNSANGLYQYFRDDQHTCSYTGYGKTKIFNSTIYNNTEGISHEYGDVELKNTILAGNTDYDCDPQVISMGYNLIQNTSNCSIVSITTGNITGVDPLLEPLAANGGPTKTHALKNGSPALDAGDPNGCTDGTNMLLTDQRGEDRHKQSAGAFTMPQTKRCDMGAYESAYLGFGEPVTPDRELLQKIKRNKLRDKLEKIIYPFWRF